MNIAVFCSSREELEPQFVNIARTAGLWIANHHHNLIYGGVKAGLMHVVAQEVARGGQSQIVGVIPKRFAHRLDPLVTVPIQTNDLGDRKAVMIDSADAFVVLPGGIGTVDEWMSTLSQICVDPNDKRTIIVTNIDGIYDCLIDYLNASASTPFSQGKGVQRSIIVTNQDEFINQLNKITQHEK